MREKSEMNAFMETILGVGVVIERSGLYLLGLRRGALGFDTWGFPGGHLEPGEDPLACAAREVMEETGLHLHNARAAGWSAHVEGSRRLLTLYVVGDAEGEARVTEPLKCAGWRWFRRNQCPGPLFGPTAGYFASVI